MRRKTNGGDEGIRTPDLRVANAALSQAELHPHILDQKLQNETDTTFLQVDQLSTKDFKID